MDPSEPWHPSAGLPIDDAEEWVSSQRWKSIRPRHSFRRSNSSTCSTSRSSRQCPSTKSIPIWWTVNCFGVDTSPRMWPFGSKTVQRGR